MQAKRTSPNVLLVGHVCIDRNISEQTRYVGWGSSVLYMARYMQRNAGMVPTVISSYGKDMLPYLRDTQVYPALPEHERTLVYENDSRKQPRVQHVRNYAAGTPPQLDAAVAKLVADADIIAVAPLLSNYDAPFIQQLLSRARPGCLKVLLPQGYFRKIAADGKVLPTDFAQASGIVPAFDVVVFSEEDHPAASALAREWKQLAPGTAIVVTQGANGASIVGSANSDHVPTTPILPEDIVDSVGCGDTFAARLMLDYFYSKSIPGAVAQANIAAGIKLRTPSSKL